MRVYRRSQRGKNSHWGGATLGFISCAYQLSREGIAKRKLARPAAQQINKLPNSLPKLKSQIMSSPPCLVINF